MTKSELIKAMDIFFDDEDVLISDYNRLECIEEVKRTDRGAVIFSGLESQITENSLASDHLLRKIHAQN